MNYKIGDRLKVVSEETDHMTYDMIKLLGKVVTIKSFSKSGSSYHIEGDEKKWHWKEEDFVGLVHDFEPYEGELKVGDNVRIRRDSEYAHQSKLVGVILDIITKDICPYKVKFDDHDNAYGLKDLELVSSSNIKQEVLSTNSNTLMYKATAINDRMNAKFFTDSKLDELTLITEQIEVRVQQTKETIAKLSNESITIENIGSKLNRAVDNKNIKEVEEALKSYDEFIANEEIEFQFV